MGLRAFLMLCFATLAAVALSAIGVGIWLIESRLPPETATNYAMARYCPMIDVGLSRPRSRRATVCGRARHPDGGARSRITASRSKKRTSWMNCPAWSMS